MKKVLTHLFVFVVNYHLLSAFIGLVMMLVTLFVGSLNVWFYSGIGLAAILLCLIYQIVRNKFDYYSFGEVVIGNYDKADIMNQTKTFSKTRVPLFLLIVVTLSMICTTFYGIGSGRIFSLGFVIFFALLVICTFYGIKNFVIKPDMLPIFLLMGGLLYASMMFKHPQIDLIPDVSMTDSYYVLLLVWFITAFIYKKYSIQNLIVSEN